MLEMTIINITLVIALAVIMLYHSYRFKGLMNTLVFAIISGGIGVSVEYVGVSSGGYGYTGQNILMVLLFTGFGWIANTYMSMHLTKVILQMYNKDTISPKDSFKLGVSTGLLGVMYDLFTDPVDTALKVWTWSYEGVWFGVPTGNFIGWFVILTSAVTGYALTLYYGKTKEHKILLAIFFVIIGTLAVTQILNVCWVLGLR